MKLRHVIGLLLVVVAAAAVFVPVAASMLLPWGMIKAPVVLTAPVGPVVVPTVLTLPGATYPWIQPNWVKIGAVTRPIASANHVGVPVIQPLRLFAH